MQNGLMMCAALLGVKHIKWGANKEGRKEGEMMQLFLCPKSSDGSLDVQPQVITVSSDEVPAVQKRLITAKQFDTFLVNLEMQKDRLIFKSFFELPK